MKIGDAVHYIDEHFGREDLPQTSIGIHNLSYITSINDDGTLDLEIHRHSEIIYRKGIYQDEINEVINTWHNIE